ncbi:MAG: MFS transporter [Anaerolineaceae bacterium]|nr:MFS transporter [Anaerolineaceae bacterium]MBN2676642.1 MFS transporter [Anaerolineaceae bacterium]
MPLNSQHSLPDNWKRRFFTIWTGQAFSLFGSSLVQFALVWWLTQKTGSATILATATLVALLPQIFLSPLAGPLIDRWNRRLVLIFADGLIALFSLGLMVVFLFGREQIWHIYVIMFFRSLGGAFHWPTMQASTSLMVPDAQLSRVAGLNQALHGVMSIIAPPLGALLLSALPMYGIILIDVVTAIIAIIPLFFIAIPQPVKKAVVHQVEGIRAVIKEMVEGFRYVVAWPGMLIILIIAALLNFLLNPAFSLMPLLVTKVYNGTAYHLGLLEAVFGIGVVVGGLALSAWGGFKKRIHTTIMGIVGMGVGVLMIGFTTPDLIWMAVVGMTIVGVMNPLANGPLMAILQSTVDPAMQGRVFTLTASLSSAMSPLSLAIAGPLADKLGIPIWYIAAGSACVLMGACSLLVKPVMHVEDGKTRPEVETPKLAVTNT